MAAGLGFKTFAVGEVLSAANVNGYLMQGVLVFANATARDAAITSPQEGQFAYLKDTNVTTYYTGSSWANLDTTGMTNPMTTTGDTIYSSSGSTPARLAIGTAGQVLKVNAGATAPEWGAAGGASGLTFINKYEPSSVSTQAMNDIFSSTYKYYKIVWSVVMSDSAELQLRLRVSGNDATSNYNISQVQVQVGNANAQASVETAIGAIPLSYGATSGIKTGELLVLNPFTATKTGINYQHYSENNRAGVTGGLHTDSTSYTGCSIYPATGTITGEITVYGFNRS